MERINDEDLATFPKNLKIHFRWNGCEVGSFGITKDENRISNKNPWFKEAIYLSAKRKNSIENLFANNGIDFGQRNCSLLTTVIWTLGIITCRM